MFHGYGSLPCAFTPPFPHKAVSSYSFVTTKKATLKTTNSNSGIILMECDTNSDLHYFGWYEYPREYVTSCKIVVMEGESDEKCVINITFLLMMPSISSNNYQRTASLMNMNSFDKARHPPSLYSHVQPSSTPFSLIFTFTFLSLMSTNILHMTWTYHITPQKMQRSSTKKEKSHLEISLCRCKLLFSAWRIHNMRTRIF